MPKEKQRKSGKYCVAAGCTSTHVDGISLHEFPNEKRGDIRRRWVNFVKIKRKNFTQPTPYSVLCEKHFTADSYTQEYEYKKSFGIPVTKKCLLPHAVPTIHAESLSSPPVPPRSACCSTSTNVDSSTSSPVPVTPKTPGTRAAFRKRECMRAILEDAKTNPEIEERDNNVSDDTDMPPAHTGRGVKTVHDGKRTVGFQFGGRKPPRRSVRVQAHPKGVDKAFQVDFSADKPKMVSVGTQCSLKQDSMMQQDAREQTPLLEDYDSEVQEDTPCDSDYSPSSEDEVSEDGSDSMSIEGEESIASPAQERKFLVFESQLLQLFYICPKCASPSLAQVQGVVGSMVRIGQTCGVCGFHRIWSSQPMVGAVPAGNLLISAGLLFSGLVPGKALRFLDHINMEAISVNTFHNHQKYYLQPAISGVWKQFQNHYFSNMIRRGEPLTIGGDGRADTPGHSAKYGSYAMLDLDLMVVVDIQLVQSNEVKSSYHMEKEGLIRGVQFIEGKGLQIGELVTDRHVQIVKHVREQMPNTIHHFDVWHVAKGLRKKLSSLAREKECNTLTPWIKSICNHLYWVAASTPDGNGQLMLAKWDSLVNHIQNRHHHEGSLFPQCAHGSLEGRDSQKKWLKSGTKVSVKLEEIVQSRQMLKDVPKLSPGPQTAVLEAFHGVVNHFAPKMFGFSYYGMLCRLRLAALHYNENGMRDQATTKDGDKRYNVVFPKFKSGESTIREVKVACTFGYVHELMNAVFSLADTARMHSTATEDIPHRVNAPPALCSNFARPDVPQAIRLATSRYGSSKEKDTQ